MQPKILIFIMKMFIYLEKLKKIISIKVDE